MFGRQRTVTQIKGQFTTLVDELTVIEETQQAQVDALKVELEIALAEKQSATRFKTNLKGLLK